MKQTTHWILVADSSRARVLQDIHGPHDSNENLDVLAGYIHSAGRLHRADLESDAPGSFMLHGSSRTSAEPHEDADRLEACKFAAELCEHLDQACDQKLFDGLIVVAPPRFLGILRQQMSPRLHARVITEINRDLASLTDSQLRPHLVTFLAKYRQQSV